LKESRYSTAGQRQQVTDYPSLSIKLAFSINLDTGEVLMSFGLGRLEPIIFNGFRIEQSEK